MPTQRPRQAAFTLIELLVVIAIVAVLAAFAVPAVGKARESGNRAKCSSNMRQLSAAYLIMVSERSGALVGASGGGRTWYTELESYVPLKTGNDFLRVSCPSALAKMKSLGYKYTVTRPSYGLNSSIGLADPTKPADDPANRNSTLLRMGSVSKPSSTLLLGEGSIVNAKDGLSIGVGVSGNTILTPYHGDKCAIAYFDGHAGHVDNAFIDLMKSTRKTEGSEGSIFWKGY